MNLRHLLQPYIYPEALKPKKDKPKKKGGKK